MNNNPNHGNSCKTKENPMKSIVTGLLTGAMAGETGPTTGAVAELAGVKPTAKWEQPPSGQ